MRNISNEFASLLAANHTLLMKATLTLADSTVLNLTSDDFMAGSARFEQAVSSDGSFDIGGAIVGIMSVTLANHTGRFDGYDLEGATIVPYVGKLLSNNTYEWLRLGTYDVIKPDFYGGTIGITCSDVLNRLARHKLSELSTTYPVYPQALLSAIMAHVGLAITYDASPVNNTVGITRAPDVDMTLLDAAGYLAQVMGYWLVCNSAGGVTASWYDTTAFAPGSTPYEIEDAFSTSVMTNDVTITGVQVTETDEVTLDSDGYEINGNAGGTYLYGTDDYCLVIPYNPFIEYGNGLQVATALYSRVGGMCFRPYTNSMPCDPVVEVGDAVIVTDRHGNTYNAYVTGVVLKPDGAMDTRCTAKAPASNSNLSASPLSMAVTALKASVERSDRVANTAETLAGEAKSIATATNQNFWADLSGVHVSTDDGDPDGTNNILLNSGGMLVRELDKNRAALTPSGVAFYDGLGNLASNVVASFGASGAQVGALSDLHMLLGSSGIQIVDPTEGTVLTMSVINEVFRLLSTLGIHIGHKSGSKSAIFDAHEITGLSSGNGEVSVLESTYDSTTYARLTNQALDSRSLAVLMTEFGGNNYSRITSASTASRSYNNLEATDNLVNGYAPVFTETKSITVPSTAARTNYVPSSAINVAKTGYTVKGVVNKWWSGGTRQNFMLDWGTHTEGNSLWVRLCNVHPTDAASGTYVCEILYVQNSIV